MPAALPPNSAYTYAVELGSEEAEALSATSVRFSSPVIAYLDNFLGIPLGTGVPVGWYDRTVGLWKANPDGRVLQLLSVANGLVDIDLDGDGKPETRDELIAAGISDGERETLASLFPGGGRSFWRFVTSHFSTIDCNFPGMNPPPDADWPPPVPPIHNTRPIPDPNCNSGSIVECENQTLGEVVPISGTPFSLRYRNDQATPDFGGTKITISGPFIPASLQSIHLQIKGAGRVFDQDFAPAPNILYHFQWDGKDAYGRILPADEVFNVKIIYYYNVFYGRTISNVAQSGGSPDGGSPDGSGLEGGSFGSLAADAMFVRGRWQYMMTRLFEVTVGRYFAPQLEFGRWTINVHHRYDPDTNTLFRGDGELSQPIDMRSSAEVIAGGGKSLPAEGVTATAVDLMPALGSTQVIPKFSVGPDGTIYLAVAARETLDLLPITRIWAMGRDGKLKLFAGYDDPGIRFARDLIPLDQDDVPATTTTFQNVHILAATSDGNVYVVQRGFQDQSTIVRRIGPDGIIRRFAGSRGHRGFGGDLGRATDAILGDPGVGMAADSWGNVFIPDNNRIRRVDSNGVISTFAFSGASAAGPFGRFKDENQPALIAALPHPTQLQVADDGTLYVSASLDQIIRVGSDGRARTIGGDLSVPGVAQTACDVSIGSCLADFLSLSPSQDLDFLSGLPPNVRRLSVDGTISAVTSSQRTPACIAFGAPAAATCVDGSRGFGVWGLDHLPSGATLVGVQYSKLLRIAPKAFENSIPSSDGTKIFVFDSTGRHLRTLHAQTLTTEYEFQYDARGLLAAIVDGDGNVTKFERSADGLLQGIVSPFGVTTAVTFDASGNLASVQDPAGRSMTMTTDASGLLTQLVDGRGQRHAFSYDSVGLLLKDVDAAGEMVSLSREDNGGQSYTVTKSTALGRKTSYKLEFGARERRRTTTSPAGAIEQTIWRTDGTVSGTGPSGITQVVKTAPDPRFGMLAPRVLSQLTTTPGGVTRAETRSTTVVPAGPTGGPFSFASSTEVRTVNGRSTTTTYDAASRTIMILSPAGRTKTFVMDAHNRLLSQQIGGLAPITYAYDPRGRLASVQQGGRSYLVDYDSSGFLKSVTDPLGRQVILARDPSGVVLAALTPGSRSISLTYDGNLNTTSIQVPTGGNHAFQYGPSDRLQTYLPPQLGGSSGAVSYMHDLDGELVGTTTPLGQIKYSYDDAGRLSAMTTDRTILSFSYAFPGGPLASVVDANAMGASPTGSSVAFTFDGDLMTGAAWTGAVQGAVANSYDNDYRLVRSLVTTSPAVALTYDLDGLIGTVGLEGVANGTMTISRDSQSGFLAGTTLGSVTTRQGLDRWGDVSSISASNGAVVLFSATLTRDAGGRISQKVETVQGSSKNYFYAYDDAGRLVGVTVDGQAVGRWPYDPNGNRVAVDGAMATYDARDRLQAYGAAQYTYDDNGNPTVKREGSSETRYRFDLLGALVSVDLPTGHRIEYLLDALGHRVGRSFDGAFDRGWLYEGLRPIAEVNASGAVTARFVYGSKAQVPDFMWKGGAVYRLISDERGSVRLVVNTGSGSVVQRLDYDPWGNVTVDTNPGFQPFGFAGGLWDASTRLTHFGARELDSVTGRWISRDPRGFAGQDSNFYTYVGNDPINLIDTSGSLFKGLINAGEAYGADAAQWWADRSVDPNNSIIETLIYTAGGLAATLWTPCTSDSTFTVLTTALGIGSYLNRPYWQYYPAGHPEYTSPWITRGWGWSPPYEPGEQAAQFLSLPLGRNPGTAVRAIEPPPFKFLGGPRTVSPNPDAPGLLTGGGVEYKIGGF